VKCRTKGRWSRWAHHHSALYVRCNKFLLLLLLLEKAQQRITVTQGPSPLWHSPSSSHPAWGGACQHVKQVFIKAQLEKGVGKKKVGSPFRIRRSDLVASGRE
jgi:hypothetical protein